MFAVRDQENLVHGQQQAAAAKPLNQVTRGLQPKTPGNKYPKTPLKIPLNDENAPTGFGKTIKGKGQENLVTGGKKGTTFDKNAFITPMGPRTRAPLGMKTTNAKAKAFQTPAGPAPESSIQKTQPKQTTGRRPKKVIHADAVKLEIHGDESPLRDNDEVEYCPPKPKDLPYESDVFPKGCLSYEGLKKENLMRGIWKNYHVRVDENGVSMLEREAEEAYKKSAAEADEAIQKMMEEDWTVGDVPETFRHLRKKQSSAPESSKPKVLTQHKKSEAIFSKGPATIASRKAATALSVAPKTATIPPKVTKPAPKTSFLSRSKPAPIPSVPSHASTMRSQAASAVSRSTLGYNKGRSASGALHPPSFSQAPTLQQPQRRKPGGLTRSTSNMSSASDSTITPARFAMKQEPELESKNPKFMEAFMVDEEDLEIGLRGGLPECLRKMDDDDEDYVFKLGDE